MSVYKRTIQRNYTKGRGGTAISQITIHTAVSNAQSLYSFFNKEGTNASSHYYVNKEGVVEQYVEDSNTSWANSNLASNRRSITIETWDGGKPNDPIRTSEMYNALAYLVANVCKRYGIPPILLTKEQSQTDMKGITQHRFFANKSCPAGLDLNRIVKSVESILNLGYNQDMTFSEVVKKERPDVEKVGINPEQWWISNGHNELMDVLDKLSRTDVIDHINKSSDKIDSSKDWYYKYGSREYSNIWNAPREALMAQNQAKELGDSKDTIQTLTSELEALRHQITACGVSLDGYKEKYSQEMIKNEMIIVEKNEKIHSLEKKIAEYKEKGVESLSWSELLLMAFNKLLKKKNS